MTLTEKQELLSKIGQRKADLQTKLQMAEDEYRALEATPVTTPHKVWEPGHNDKYYRSPTMIPTLHDKTEVDINNINSGIAHPTKEAAERHHSFLVMLHDLHKFAVEHNEGWKPDWSQHQQDKYMILLAGVGFSPDKIIHPYNLSILPYFKSEAIAQKAIDTFGERLKILFEYYNS